MSGPFSNHAVVVLGLLLAGAGTGGDARAQSAAAPAAQAEPKPESVYNDLRNVERVAIRFQGFPDLTGEYRVNADQTISIPGVGRVPVGGIGPAELEAILMRRIVEISGREGFATVEVAAYKPVLVSGYVARPGAVPWQPGMTVRHALTLAGGVYRVGSGANAETPPVLVGDAERARIRKAIDEKKRVLATLARLRAELQGREQIELPDDLVALAGRDEARALVEAQNAILAQRRTALDQKLEAVERARVVTRQEIDGLREQRARIEDQLRLRRESRDKLAGLLARGLILAERSLEEEVRVSELEEKTTNIAVAMTRAQATLSGLERDALALNQDRLVPVQEEIQRLERESAQLGIEIETASEAYRKLTGVRPQSTGPSNSNAIAFAIVRAADSSQRQISAELSTSVLPSDILVVTLGNGAEHASAEER
jgi:exopolysaccharide production protein ExoF